MSLLVERYGAEQVVELYRAVGRAGTAGEVDQAFRDQLGTTTEDVTRLWRASLARRLR